MGLFRKLFGNTKPKIEQAKTIVCDNVKNKLTFTPLPHRAGVSEVFRGDFYLGLLFFYKGRGCSCKDSYQFKPHRTNAVFAFKSGYEYLVKQIELLEIPEKTKIYLRLYSGDSEEKIKKQFSDYLNNKWTENILKNTIQKTKVIA